MIDRREYCMSAHRVVEMTSCVGYYAPASCSNALHPHHDLLSAPEVHPHRHCQLVFTFGIAIHHDAPLPWHMTTTVLRFLAGEHLRLAD